MKRIFGEILNRLIGHPPGRVALIAAGLSLAAHPGSAQRAGGEERSRFLERIDAEEGRARMEAFRGQGLAGDFIFGFELAHKPYRSSRTERHRGVMWGSWHGGGPVTRVRLRRGEGSVGVEASEVVELIVRSGEPAGVWRRTGLEGSFERLDEDAYFEPVFAGVLFRPFDLQMPFVHWPEYRYEGPGRMGAYAAVQYFLMLPPEDSAAAERGVSGVRLAIDDDYNALRRASVLGPEGEPLSEFTAEGFKKVEDQWIVSRITLEDMETRARTTFEVESAALGRRHDPSWFDPASRAVPPAGVAPEAPRDDDAR